MGKGTVNGPPDSGTQAMYMQNNWFVVHLAHFNESSDIGG